MIAPEVIPMYNYRCDNCGAYLDPGERCTCRSTYEKNLRMVEELLEPDPDGQMTLKETMKYGAYTRIRRLENDPAGI